MSYSIRAMRAEDYEPVYALWVKTDGVGVNECDTRDGVQAFLERNPNMSAVALDAGQRLVGAVLCGHDGRRGYLHHLAVAPEHRRHGLARKMLDLCFAEMRRLGIVKCNIFLFNDNNAGEAFWLHNGWKRRGDLQVLQKPV